ncbi:hypothetical protein F511_08899 [Dorcoceras hygrometricum]|uniref:Uncharacterized protein n=1 Tax=Dorcoceras hygrometricum TaxID=472368 RepID=A0A2Z7AVQ9_9LAMI|nr:hypothetical protein F511_08899 [Dorcoceras hygrometricum]
MHLRSVRKLLSRNPLRRYAKPKSSLPPIPLTTLPNRCSIFDKTQPADEHDFTDPHQVCEAIQCGCGGRYQSQVCRGQGGDRVGHGVERDCKIPGAVTPIFFVQQRLHLSYHSALANFSALQPHTYNSFPSPSYFGKYGYTDRRESKSKSARRDRHSARHSHQGPDSGSHRQRRGTLLLDILTKRLRSL